MVAVDESNPSAATWPANPVLVSFSNDSGRPRAAAADLAAAIEPRAECLAVTEAEVSFSSTLTDLGILRLFPALESVRVGGREVTDLSALAELPRLRKLSVDVPRCARDLGVLARLTLDTLTVEVCKRADVGALARASVARFLGLRKWRWPDLAGLRAPHVTDMTINGGAVRSTAGIEAPRLESAYLAACTKLVSLAGLHARSLTVSSCRRLPPEAFAEVEGLESLYLTNHAVLDSLAFVGRIPALRRLSIDATRVDSSALGPLVDAPELRRVWLPKSVTASAIEEVARRNPRLAISNGDTYFSKGVAVPAEVYDAHCGNGPSR